MMVIGGNALAERKGQRGCETNKQSKKSN